MSSAVIGIVLVEVEATAQDAAVFQLEKSRESNEAIRVNNEVKDKALAELKEKLAFSGEDSQFKKSVHAMSRH